MRAKGILGRGTLAQPPDAKDATAKSVDLLASHAGGLGFTIGHILEAVRDEVESDKRKTAH